MAKTTDGLKRSNVALAINRYFDPNKGIMVRQEVYIGVGSNLKAITRDVKLKLADPNSDIRQKIAEIGTKVGEVEVISISTTFAGQEAASANRLIDKYDTINKGWNIGYYV